METVVTSFIALCAVLTLACMAGALCSFLFKKPSEAREPGRARAAALAPTPIASGDPVPYLSGEELKVLARSLGFASFQEMPESLRQQVLGGRLVDGALEIGSRADVRRYGR
jgi:hypothetical protein